MDFDNELLILGEELLILGEELFVSWLHIDIALECRDFKMKIAFWQVKILYDSRGGRNQRLSAAGREPMIEPTP